MIEQEKGYVLNVSSVAAFQPTQLYQIYGATKAYVRSFSQALHEELSPFGMYLNYSFVLINTSYISSLSNYFFILTAIHPATWILLSLKTHAFNYQIIIIKCY